MEHKSFARTVRMKPRIREYVEQQPGATFAEKFENMVITYVEKEDAILREIAELHAQQQQEKDKLQSLIEGVRKIEKCKLVIDMVLNNMDRVKHDLERV